MMAQQETCSPPWRSCVGASRREVHQAAFACTLALYARLYQLECEWNAANGRHDGFAVWAEKRLKDPAVAK